MKYYVVADVHGYYNLFKTALEEVGYFRETEPHKLIICGDLFDRGTEALEMQNFVLDLLNKDEVILIRGNHEDLFINMVDKDGGIPTYQSSKNGTYDTALQLTGYDKNWAYQDRINFCKECRNTPFYNTIIPNMQNYFETDHYIFVHGWIPMIGNSQDNFIPMNYLEGWRNASNELWDRARWENGMAASLKVRVAGKIIVCGHWHCSYGHCRIEGTSAHEFGEDADFSPYKGEGIIAIDACTTLSNKVNCIVLEE